MRTCSRVPPTRQGRSWNRTTRQPRRENDAPRLLCGSRDGFYRRRLLLPRRLRSKRNGSRSVHTWSRTPSFSSDAPDHRRSYAQHCQRTFLHSFYRRFTYFVEIPLSSTIRYVALPELYHRRRDLHSLGCSSTTSIPASRIQLWSNGFEPFRHDLRLKLFEPTLLGTCVDCRSFSTRSTRSCTRSRCTPPSSTIFRSSYHS